MRENIVPEPVSDNTAKNLSIGLRCLSVAVLSILVFAFPVRAEQAGVISAPAAHEAILHGGTELIDVREDYEVQGAAPLGARAHIPYRMNHSRDEAFIADALHAGGGDRTSNVTLICATGVRSAAARDLLLKHGFTNVKSLAGGFESWRSAGLPIIAERSSKAQ